MPESDHELIIIGGGPAGLTAGLYAARSGLKSVLIERFVPGGQVLNTDWVENYPGFPDGATGFSLMEKMKAHVEKFDLATLSAEVEGLAARDDLIEVRLSDKTLTTKSLIIASGAEPSRLNVEGEFNLTGHGVSYCGTCDGPFYKDMVIAAVGGGDTACEEAIYLTRFAKEVLLIHRRDKLRAQKVLQDRILSNEKIRVMWNTVVEAIEGHEKVDGVRIRNVKTNKTEMLPVEGVFVFVGVKPNTAFAAGFIELDEQGFIPTDAEMLTSRPSVFAAGDCRVKQLRQISTAVGDGATAAYAVRLYLESLEVV